MPTYDYQCDNCQKIQEEFHSMMVEPVIMCNDCGSSCKKKFAGNTTFILKGSDWPSQEFRTKNSMSQKNTRMKSKMVERTHAGEAVTSVKDLK